ncbi:MAG TPA: hypothetical protein VHP38_06410 [Ruminiclostridium sp.]|nr:hypothetical protein [Ruminiclostridium sp.]
MTVEVGIINRKGAVLAADSASTVKVGGRNKTISTDKIFALSKAHFVGIMVYDNAYFTNIPWETVIKGFRSHIGENPFDTLKDYADDFPTICEYRIVGRISGKLIYEVRSLQKIDTTSKNVYDTYGYIVPFAQKDVIKAYIFGIDPVLKDTLESKLKTIFNNLFEVIQSECKNAISDEFSSKYRDIINNVGKILGNQIEETFRIFQNNNYIIPFFTMINFLGKVELAALAEALVNLTITRRRFTTDEETVGGATDVAIITKGEGFIWVRRKEFFHKTEIITSDNIG